MQQRRLAQCLDPAVNPEWQVTGADLLRQYSPLKNGFRRCDFSSFAQSITATSPPTTVVRVDRSQQSDGPGLLTKPLAKAVAAANGCRDDERCNDTLGNRTGPSSAALNVIFAMGPTLGVVFVPHGSDRANVHSFHPHIRSSLDVCNNVDEHLCKQKGVTTHAQAPLQSSSLLFLCGTPFRD